MPRRFSTQMYIYLLPPEADLAEKEMFVHRPDWGIEHTAASFLPAAAWIDRADRGEILLFPPQAFLLHLLAQYLTPYSWSQQTPAKEQCHVQDVIQEQRKQLLEFLQSGDPIWREKCICPRALEGVEGRRMANGNAEIFLDLGWPGPELEAAGRRGDIELILIVEWEKNLPRRSKLKMRSQIPTAGKNEQGKL